MNKLVKIKENKMNYSVVIVTYNRIDLLQECISYINSQAVAANHIIIVNNASTDGTATYLDSIKSNNVIIVKHLNENTGGAGGFYEALKIAASFDDDWVAIIDDDAMLDANFMTQIKKASENNPFIHAFAGAVYQEGKIDTQHRQMIKRPGFFGKRIPEFNYEKSYFDCKFASFCGLVIRTSLIKQIGLPRKEYFIWNDDIEYCLRICKKTLIRVIPAAIVNHKATQSITQKPRRYTWKDFYGFKNRMDMIRRHGNFADRVYYGIYLAINVGFRNWLFHMLHYKNYDWVYERKIYHMVQKSLRGIKIK
jgi:GT2 family glycosyltransferase